MSAITHLSDCLYTHLCKLHHKHQGDFLINLIGFPFNRPVCHSVTVYVITWKLVWGTWADRSYKSQGRAPHKDIYRDRLRLGVGRGRQRPRRALPDLSPGPWHATGMHCSYDTNLTWSCSCNNWIWCFRGRSILTDKV